MGEDLFILGTSHTLQCGVASVPREVSLAFESEVRRLCAELGIKRIAEEMSDAGLERQGVTETVCQRVAGALKLAHHNVDLSPAERRSLSLDDSAMINTAMRRSFPDGGSGFREAFEDLADGVRERCWIGRILSERPWPVLFVCGADHVAVVRKLWCCLGLDAKVLHRDYAP